MVLNVVGSNPTSHPKENPRLLIINDLGFFFYDIPVKFPSYRRLCRLWHLLVLYEIPACSGCEEGHNFRVTHGDLHDRDAGVLLKIFIDGRNIVPKLVQLK